MRRNWVTVGSVGAVAALMLASCNDNSGPAAPAGLPTTAATSFQITRGRYLVTAVGTCADCHSQGIISPTDPYWLAGYVHDATLNPGDQGVFHVGPFTTYAANLTPDVATGLGSWTAQDIFNALRTGHDKSGMYLCPPMPWPVFSNMTDADIWSIVAYLQSIKPVHNAVPEATGPGVPAGQHPDCSSFYTHPTAVPPYPAGNEIVTSTSRSVTTTPRR